MIVECEKLAEAAKLDPSRFHEATVAALHRKLSSLKRSFSRVFDRFGTDIAGMVAPGQVAIVDASLAPQNVRRSVVSYLASELLRGRINEVMKLENYVVPYPLLLVVEEAHNYAGADTAHSCKSQLSRVASEGRKFGLGLLVVSQKPSKIDEEILSQCNTGVYMHITNPRDKEHIKKSFECISEEIISDLDSLDVGECIIAGAMIPIPFLLCKVDRIEVEKERKSKFDFKTRLQTKHAKQDYV
jgi:DNA helicase HerA-like ATPase